MRLNSLIYFIGKPIVPKLAISSPARSSSSTSSSDPPLTAIRSPIKSVKDPKFDGVSANKDQVIEG